MQVAGGQTAVGEREMSALTAHHLPPAESLGQEGVKGE
jgi:hypothetical protein